MPTWFTRNVEIVDLTSALINVTIFAFDTTERFSRQAIWVLKMSRLFDFFFTNGSVRFKAYATSAAIALTYTLANLWGLRRKEQDVVPEMIGILLTRAFLI